jgi:hypothetical protein
LPFLSASNEIDPDENGTSVVEDPLPSLMALLLGREVEEMCSSVFSLREE